MFIVVGFVGSEFGIFGGFGWVRSSVLHGKPGFERVRSSTSRVRSSSEFVIFGFDPTLIKNGKKGRYCFLRRDKCLNATLMLMFEGNTKIAIFGAPITSLHIIFIF